MEKNETYDKKDVIRNKDTGEIQWVNKDVIDTYEKTKEDSKAFKVGRGNQFDNKTRRSYMAQPNVKEFNKTFYKRALTGRPLTWSSVEELESNLLEYFKLCDKTDTIPTITAIATWLHCSRELIYRHANDTNSPFHDTLKSVINICHTSLENGAVDGKVNSVVYIFMGKNYFNLEDSKNITVTPATSDFQANNQATMDAIQKQLAEETVPNADYHED